MLIVVDKPYETGCPWVYMVYFHCKESSVLAIGHSNRLTYIVRVDSEVLLNTL